MHAPTVLLVLHLGLAAGRPAFLASSGRKGRHIDGYNAWKIALVEGEKSVRNSGHYRTSWKSPLVRSPVTGLSGASN
jgi:hypothetical protein